VRPLLCSLATTPRFRAPDTEFNWDAFWREKRIKGKLSNAQRVAEGLPRLGICFSKLGQILATRPDVLHADLADALANLQDNMRPFDNQTAQRIVRRDLSALLRQTAAAETNTKRRRYLQTQEDLNQFLKSLFANEPVAAASIAQVYKGHLPGYGAVAVKVQRPGLRRQVERDATLFHSVAAWLENLKWPMGTPLEGQRLVDWRLVPTVDEFTARVFEEMDFVREAENARRFAELYCAFKMLCVIGSPTVP